MPINSFLYPGAKTTPAYEVANSCRFEDGDSAYMHKTPSSDGNRQTFTISVWLKRGNLGSQQNILGSSDSNFGNGLFFQFQSDDTFRFGFQDPNQFKATNRVFRDTSAWYNIIVAVDVNQASNSNRVKIYVNGTQETSFATDNTMTDVDKDWNNQQAHSIGRSGAHDNQYFDGYLAEVVSIDGLQLAASSFGEFDEDSPNIWKPKDVSGLTFGTNGFYLDFEASGNLGNDANGGTDLTEVNLAAVDQCQDSPTNNFATWNSLYRDGAQLSQGNTVGANNAGTAPQYISGISSIGMFINTGIYYCEIKLVSESSSGESLIGVGGDVETLDLAAQTESGTGWFGIRNDNGLKYYNTSNATSQHGGFTAGDIMGLAFDSTNKKLTFSKNGGWWNGTGTWGGTSPDYSTHYIDCSGGSYGTFYFYGAASNGASVTSTWAANFGNGSYGGTAISSAGTNATGQDGLFEYSMPSSSKVLSTKGLNS